MQAEHRPQQHRLAAARAADDAEHFAGIHIEVDAVVHDLRAEAIDDAADGNDWRALRRLAAAAARTAESWNVRVTLRFELTSL